MPALLAGRQAAEAWLLGGASDFSMGSCPIGAQDPTHCELRASPSDGHHKEAAADCLRVVEPTVGATGIAVAAGMLPSKCFAASPIPSKLPIVQQVHVIFLLIFLDLCFACLD